MDIDIADYQELSLSQNNTSPNSPSQNNPSQNNPPQNNQAIDGFFEDGIPVGVWAWRDEKGNIIKKETFKRKEKGFLSDMKEYVEKEMIK